MILRTAWAKIVFEVEYPIRMSYESAAEKLLETIANDLAKRTEKWLQTQKNFKITFAPNADMGWRDG